MEISCIVLAGGRSLRLGRNKALATISQRNLLERVAGYLSSFDGDILVVAASEYDYPQLDNYPRLRVVGDIHLGKGPLGGLYTGLRVSRSFYNLVLACDMPFLNRDLLSYMVQLSARFDVVIPRWGDMMEPLCAVYSKGCLPAIEELLRQDRLRVSGLLDWVKVRYVEAGEIDRFDPEHLSFFNVNTKADFKTAIEMVRE
ncbi:MAG: molybdenum cofactor guanylyltransferase [Dehalococcoidales bacterium]|nr:molybdenum cofactor guanylyltransferase [Dehalococcoidales bacterium]